MSFIMMALTGISLAMDAFAVSISCGLSCQKTKNTLPTALKVSLAFGIFQGLMTLLGWIVGLSFKDFISAYDHWIAFILLALIGGKMMSEAVEEDGCQISLGSNRMLFSLAIATSIDALAVGISFSILNITLWTITLTSVIIGVITFVFCFLGTYIGAKIGCNPKFKAKVDIAGGLILILLGAKILLEHTILV